MLTRKKFIWSGITITAITAFLPFIWRKIRHQKQEEKKTVKFLTTDGKLVELDIDKLPTHKEVASKEDIKNWIKY